MTPEQEAVWNRLNRVAYHLEDGLGPNGLLGPYIEEQADAVRGLVDDLDYVLDWLEAQPSASERWEPVDGRVDCACCSLDCGEYAATTDYRGIWYLWVEDREGHAEITLPDDVRLCRRVEVTE